MAVVQLFFLWNSPASLENLVYRNRSETSHDPMKQDPSSLNPSAMNGDGGTLQGTKYQMRQVPMPCMPIFHEFSTQFT